uniref:Ig-like domain-containing protein n=1 Tax=Anolis carolinensis TaxID=28377 RepID=A0A803T8M3_ANOCA
MHSSSLEVKEVQERDSGSYRVFAFNSEGSAESTASLLVARGEEQNAKYLEFLRKSEHTRQHIEHMVQKRRDERLKVDLRCIGSPFDKRQETERALMALSPTKGMVRTISFENIPSLRQEFVYDKDLVRNQHFIQGERGKEALLDEEIKLKLQRLREARRTIQEKKKMCLSQGTAEVKLSSVRTVGFRGKSGQVANQVCMASQIETKGSVFQTIEQINEKAALPIMSDTEATTKGSSDRRFERTSEEFHTRMERILGLSETSQNQELADRSNGKEAFQRQKIMTFKGAHKQQVLEQVPKTTGNMKWMDTTYTQSKPVDVRMDKKEHTEDFKTVKTVKKNPSPLVYVLFSDDVSETVKPETMMSDTITFNVNEPTPVSEHKETSRSVKTPSSLNECSLETKEDVLPKVTEIKTEIMEHTTKLESPLSKYQEPCPPFFVKEIESQEVNEGESCVFSCDFQGSSHVTVAWYNNDRPLPRSHECVINTTENHSTLTFSTTGYDQEGPITCVIFNQHGTATTSGTLNIKVKEMPEPEPINTCKIEVLPDYTEEEEELTLAFDSVKRVDPMVSTDSKATLSLPQVHFPRPCISDPDLLSLPVEIKITAPTPTPEQDEEIKEAIQHIEVVPAEPTEEQTSAGVKHKFKFSFDVIHEPPQIIKELQQHIRCTEGDSIVLECIISAEPLPIVTWFKNSRALVSTESFCMEEENGIYRLCICKISISDAGTYKCIAANKGGTVETACDVSVHSTIENLSDDIKQISLKTLQSQIKEDHELTEKEHREDFETSVKQMESSFSETIHTVRQQFHSNSTPSFSEEDTSIPTKESESYLPSYLKDIMQSLLADESESSDFQIQDQTERGTGTMSKTEELQVTILSDLDTPFLNKLSDTSFEQEQVKVESVHKSATAEKSSMCQPGNVVESHTEKKESVTVEGTSISHNVDFDVKYTDIEKMQKISKGLSFTEFDSVVSQSESSIHSEKEAKESIDIKDQEFTEDYKDLMSCQYEPTQSTSDEEMSAVDITSKEVKEQIPTSEQELNTKEHADPNFSSSVLKAMQEDDEQHQKDQCFVSTISKDSQDILTKEEASMSCLKSLGYEFLSSTGKLDILYQQENISIVSEEKGEEFLEKAKSDSSEFVCDLRQIISIGEKLETDIQEQDIQEAQESTNQYSIADAFNFSLNENPIHSYTENIEKEQNKTKSKEAYVKDKDVPEITEANTNKITESAQISISALQQEKYSNGCVSNESELEKEVNHAQEDTLCHEIKEFGLHLTSLATEMVVENQEEIVAKDISHIEGTEVSIDKIIGSNETTTSEVYNRDIYKKGETIEVKFDLKELCPQIENVSQNQEESLTESLHSEGIQLDVTSTLEIAPKYPTLLEQEIVHSQEDSQDSEHVKMSGIKEGVISSKHTIENVVQDQISLQEEQLHTKHGSSVSISSDVELVCEKHVKTEYSHAESIGADTTTNEQKMEEIVHQHFAEVMEPIKEGDNAQQHLLLPSGDIFNLKQTYSDLESNSQLQEAVQPEEIHFKNLYSVSEEMQVDTDNSKSIIEKENIRECDPPENQDIHLKLAFLNVENAASIAKEISFKEAEPLQKEEGTFNLKSAFEMVSTKTEESFIKQLQSANVLEKDISLSEELRQTYKKHVEEENSPEHELQTEANISVAQLLKQALESPSEAELSSKQHCEYQRTVSEEEVLKMPDEAFIWGQSEPTPLSLYFQNVVKETGMPEDSNSLGIIVSEADSFISDLKEAVREKVSPRIDKAEEEKSHLSECSFIKQLRSFSPEGNDTERFSLTEIMLEEQRKSSDTSDKEPSLAQFLLSLKNDSLVSQEEEMGLNQLKKQDASAQHQLEKQYEASEIISSPLEKLKDEKTEIFTLGNQELDVPPYDGTDFSLAKYFLVAGEQEIPAVRESSSKTLARESSVTSMEVEDVTFSTVYDYYNQQQELTRPFSPESEMSIDIDSMSGDEMAELERFYTPPSSVDNFEPPMASYHTPVGTPERYSTPSEERYSTPSEERYSTPSEERYSTPSEERYSTPSPGSPIRGITPPEGYRTPTNNLLQQRSFSLEELRAEMFGTPCEALEPKGNEMPPAFVKPLTKRKLYENSTLRFIAEVIGSPLPDVKWYRNKSLLEEDPRVRVQKEGDICILEIHNIKKTEGGEYMCHAINIIGEAKSLAQVEVLPHDERGLALPPPVTHQHVIQFDIEKGSASRTPSPQEILLEVELDEADIKECEKQVKIATVPELTSDSQSMIVSLDVLPLSLVEHTMDLPGKENEDVKINFEVTEMPPRFITPVSDIEVPEKSAALFHCRVLGFPTPVVQWFKESKCIVPSNGKYIVISENGNHSLNIQNVVHSDRGMYLCKAVNTVGEAMCRCFLAVTECQTSLGDGADETNVGLDSATDKPQKIDLLVDNTIQNGSQTEIELEFEFERDTDDSQKAVKLIAVTEKEQEEEGESCVNINFDVFAEPSKEEQIEFKAESTESCSFEFQVTESPPKFLKNISDCVSFVGTSARFQCLVVGSPKPEISWFKNEDLIHGERYCMGESEEGCHSLIIRNLVQDDEGEYKCVATNKAGMAHSNALLTIC